MATVISIGLVGGGVYAAISSDGSDKITASSTETAVEADAATVDTEATVDNTDETVNVETTSADTTASTDKSAAKTSEKAAKSGTSSKADSKSTSKTSSTKSTSSNKASTSTKSSKSSTSATKSHTHNWVAHKTSKTTYETETYQEEVTICSTCGADISGHAVQHLKDSNRACRGYYGSTVTKTKQVPVTTTVTDYYYCSSCGATK
jgi:RNA polymerase primary sigma factor